MKSPSKVKIEFPLKNWKKEIRKYNTSNFHVSIDGENGIVTLTSIKSK